MEQKKHNVVLISWVVFVLLLVPTMIAVSNPESMVAQNFKSATVLSHVVGLLFLAAASFYTYLYATNKVTVTGSWKFDFWIAIGVIFGGIIGFMGFFWGYF